MVPNAVVLSVAVVPLREPAAVSLRARLRPGSTPAEIEEQLRTAISTPLRGAPSVTLEEVDGDEVVVRIAATPSNPDAGPRLATEVLHAIRPHVVGSGSGDGSTPGGGDPPRPAQSPSDTTATIG
jgi:small conductance mechanosensitive channel